MADGSVGIGAKLKALHIPDVDADQPYPMNLPNVGHAVILNNVEKEMPGSVNDVEALKAAYEQVGFQVHVHKNCDVRKMAEIKKWMTTEETHKDSNSFLLTVISHGNSKGELLDVDKKRGWNTEDIVMDLDLMTNLRGKPKIIVLNACRGSNWSRGKAAPTGLLAEDEKFELTIPDKADLLIAYAAVPGYSAHGGGDSGSIYLQSFATYLSRHYANKDLDTICRMVNNYMAQTVQEESGMKQVSEKRSTLRFALKFCEHKRQASSISKTPTPIPKTPRRVKLELLGTHDTGLRVWGDTPFTVMESGLVVMWGKPSDETPAAFHLYNLTPAGWSKQNEMPGLCQPEHEEDVYLQPVRVNNKEQLAVSCKKCQMIRLYDTESGEVTTAFHDERYYPLHMCRGEGEVIYVRHAVEGPAPVLELNTAQVPFTVNKTIQSGMEYYHSMHYVPSSWHPLLVFTDWEDSLIRAVSVVTDQKRWVVEGEVDDLKSLPFGMFFSPDHNALLVADDERERVLVLNPEDGSHLQTIKFDEYMGYITHLCPYQNKLIMKHSVWAELKVTIFSIT